MTKLKPCPFCGGQAEIQVHKFHELPNAYGVKCRNCDAQTWQFYASEGHAITIWNIRVTSDNPYDREQTNADRIRAMTDEEQAETGGVADGV